MAGSGSVSGRRFAARLPPTVMRGCAITGHERRASMAPAYSCRQRRHTRIPGFGIYL